MGAIIFNIITIYAIKSTLNEGLNTSMSSIIKDKFTRPRNYTGDPFNIPYECPDCEYKNSDICNLESHQLKHSDINKYVCEKCGKGFKYNTQYR